MIKKQGIQQKLGISVTYVNEKEKLRHEKEDPFSLPKRQT